MPDLKEAPCAGCKKTGYIIFSPSKTIQCPFCLGKGVRVFTPPRVISVKEIYENSENLINENYGLNQPIHTKSTDDFVYELSTPRAPQDE